MAAHHAISDIFPYVNVRIAIRGWETNVLALLDTGFTGDVVIPANALPSDIGEPDITRPYRVADGRVTRFGLFYGDLEIPGFAPVTGISVGALGDKYIIGLGIIERYLVTLLRGERVVVEE